MWSMDSYSKAAVERAMKVQEVDVAGLGQEDHVVVTRSSVISVCWISGAASPRSSACRWRRWCWLCIGEKYFDLNVRHFHEKQAAEILGISDRHLRRIREG
jgi:hypothetical protein